MNLMRTGKMPTVTIEQAQKNFCKVCILFFYHYMIEFEKMISFKQACDCSMVGEDFIFF